MGIYSWKWRLARWLWWWKKNIKILQNRKRRKSVCLKRFKDLLMHFSYLHFTRIMRCCWMILISWFFFSLFIKIQMISYFSLYFLYHDFIILLLQLLHVDVILNITVKKRKNVTFSNLCNDNSFLKATQCETFKFSSFLFFSISIKKVTTALLIWFASARFTIAA